MNTSNDKKQRHQRGTALIVVIAIISILLIFAMGNVRTLDHLGKELRLLDQQQRAHWENIRP